MPTTFLEQLPPELQVLLRALRERLEALYNERLHRLVLYGSHARGEATDASDVDVMVVLHGDVDAWEEIKRMSDVAYHLQSESEELISIYPVSTEDYRHSSMPALVNARREGVEA